MGVVGVVSSAVVAVVEIEVCCWTVVVVVAFGAVA